jgi:hypothetical protein
VITEKQVQEAIAYCNGKVDPKRDDALLLAACYIIEDRFSKEQGQPAKAVEPLRELPNYSTAPAPDPVEKTINYTSDTQFGRMISGRPAAEVWPLIDELVNEAVQALNPRLYDAFMRKLKG